ARRRTLWRGLFGPGLCCSLWRRGLGRSLFVIVALPGYLAENRHFTSPSSGAVSRKGDRTSFHAAARRKLIPDTGYVHVKSKYPCPICRFNCFLRCSGLPVNLW